jgi:hypothetical protein
MVDLFVNANLPNYFVSAPEITSVANSRSFVPEFEAGKVVAFPKLKIDIDHEFWASLDTSEHNSLRKFGTVLQDDEDRTIALHREALLKRCSDTGLVDALCGQFKVIYDALLPTYREIFGDYSFSKKKVVWRLNTVMNENMHLDVYEDENNEHFARMFINLDTQPRIWQTSWTVDYLISMIEGKVSAEIVKNKSSADLWKEISFSLFGDSPKKWWDNQPRHVAYFSPGDVWIVDSRQVAHQIFYGRRALSIDFSVPRSAMLDPSRHYLSFVDRFRARLLERETRAPSAGLSGGLQIAALALASPSASATLSGSPGV